jgi:hypothetical protein
MATIYNGQVWRGGTVLGSVSSTACYDLNNNEIAWYEGDRLHSAGKGEIGYIQGDYIHYADTSRYARVDDIYEEVAKSDSYYDPKLCALVAMVFGRD